MFYEALQEAQELLPDFRYAYRALNSVFLQCLERGTAVAGVRFSGPFAKTDYLLKEHHAFLSLRRSVNDARVRFRRLMQTSDEDVRTNFPYDFKAVCLLVELVYACPVPAELQHLFPQERTLSRRTAKWECLRVVVNRWDDQFIMADADDADAGEVRVHYGGKSKQAVYQDWDWSYLKALLKEGCQLNLVRPRERNGILYPELIIWEPDCLMDISAVAACFGRNGASPLVHLLNKLKPSANTPAIVLGNLAGQFLDEELADASGSTTYAQSVQQFFKTNALSLLTAGIGPDFHANAYTQQQHIRHTLHEVLPELLSHDGMHFDSSDIMVEPSFFSEMLGLQGRMDFLALNQKVLIEQKAGKGEFPESDPPQQQLKHYIQLLLYMLLIRYNFRTNYELNNRELHAFLYYSKYENGLVPLGFAPELVFAAIKLRNELVAAEFDYTHDGLNILRTLTADDLKAGFNDGTLWKRYQKPQIEGLLLPIRTASALEQAYYLRFLTFLETEHLMAKIGSQTKENAGFADKWHSSLDDKLLAGNIYCNLLLESPKPTERGRVEQVVLRFGDRREHDISNFRRGDIVILYPYEAGHEPDARQTMVFRASIEQIGAEHITLSLRAAQSDASVFWHQGERQWAIEHDFFESSFNALYRGMHAFLSAPQERRDLLLFQRAPRCDKSLRLKGEYGAFNELALRVKQAKDLFLIIGPPGTGKTSYGLLTTLKEELLTPEATVLLLSYTNRAVDEICSKLVESDIDFIRIGGKSSCEEQFRPFLIDSKVQVCHDLDQLRQLIHGTRVFVGTTTAYNSCIPLFQQKQFSLAIIDEASQILEPHLVGLLSATAPDGSCAIRKMVFIGDHKQLPAVVQQREEESLVDDESLRAIHLTNCRLSLFERLLRQYRDNPDLVFMLTKQGRMHHDIALFPNLAFYQNRLQEVPLKHQNELLPTKGQGVDALADLLSTRRIAFVSVDAPQRSASDKVNACEAQAIAAAVERIYRQNQSDFSTLSTVGVIVPYRNQIAEIRSCLIDTGIEELRDITIDTVERYQGSQRDYIIYGFTVQKRYQLDFLTNNVFEEDGSLIDRKLNVAMTRARRHLLLFGNARLLTQNTTFAQLIDFVKARNGFYQLSSLNTEK